MSKDLGIKAQDILASSPVGEYVVITEMDRTRIYTEPGRELVNTLNWNAPLTPSGEKSESAMLKRHHEIVVEVGNGQHVAKPASLKDSLQSSTADVVEADEEGDVA